MKYEKEGSPVELTEEQLDQVTGGSSFNLISGPHGDKATGSVVQGNSVTSNAINLHTHDNHPPT